MQADTWPDEVVRTAAGIEPQHFSPIARLAGVRKILRGDVLLM